MTIIEIEHNNKTKTFSATIKLNYDEIRDLSHGMYYLCEDDKSKYNVSYQETHKEIALLFDLVKNGRLDERSVEMLKRLQDAIEIAKENNNCYDKIDKG